MLRVYVDSSIRKQDGQVFAGIGIVIRENKRDSRRKNKPGRIILEKAEKITIDKIVNMELTAIIRGLEIVREFGVDRVNIYSDYNWLRKDIKKMYAVNELGNKDAYKPIETLVKEFQEVKFCYVRRKKNILAHSLARKAILS